MREKENVWVLGINSAYHEPSACLIRNGQIVAAVEEERFSRIRHGKREQRADLLTPHELPIRSIRYCLERGGITSAELSHVGFSLVPEKRLRANVDVDFETVEEGAGTPEGERLFCDLVTSIPMRLSELLGEDIRDRFHWIEHHLCHAASAYFVSPWQEAAILSVDGIGESASTCLAVGSGNKIRVLKEISYPNSLGFLWTKFSRFLGFGAYGQWKVMGLGAYGNPKRHYQAFRELVDFDRDGGFSVDNSYLQFRADSYAGLESLFGKHREPDEDIEDRHQDLAAGLQQITNEVLLSLADYLHLETGLPNLCQAGGVALNCTSNRLILEKSLFERVFIQPAANDAGTALGACFYIWNQLLGAPKESRLDHVYLGPEFSRTSLLQAIPAEGIIVRGADVLEKKVADLIASGEVVAWFQGRMEFGPRALGNRSILADPRRADIVHYLNDRIKHREFFRPFAASVLSERAEEWFHLGNGSPSHAFMLLAARVREDKLGRIPAVTHVDGTCRIQNVDHNTNPRFHKLIAAFEHLTGIPAVLNTSFNDKEPIICSPEDAMSTCEKAGIRYLAIGDFLVDLVRAGAIALEGPGSDTARLSGKTSDRLLGRPFDFPCDRMHARQESGTAVLAETATDVSLATQSEGSQDAKESLGQPVKVAFRSR